MKMQRGDAVTRKSTPLSAQDVADLAAIRRAPEFAASTEAATLNRLLRIGMDAVLERQMEEGYRVLGEQRGSDIAERRSVARRRRPSWADEP
ncbi:hypothetical protein BJY21_001933 [Kineosphaera limosa]|uniref:Uncharacterized protein n=1 Tax=Kineosphaera limosa NBRC 100340 TaxID=1184609 RepID=K6WVK2_9MICO|nr:hypothetical protein [Kineosphaera limosa]NYE00749.1 hypothetical protein [Kineosphaera limosa]GAB97841.1 hypothetical protein KILIM_084_00130 [Kineosphaera limosa NBRC 100340]